MAYFQGRTVSFREATENFLLVQDLFSSTGNKTHLSLLLRGRDPFLAISVDQVDDTALSSTQHHATPVFPQRGLEPNIACKQRNTTASMMTILNKIIQLQWESPCLYLASCPPPSKSQKSRCIGGQHTKSNGDFVGGLKSWPGAIFSFHPNLGLFSSG